MTDDMTNPYHMGTTEHLLYAIFGELPGPDACECGMPTECQPAAINDVCPQCRTRRKWSREGFWYHAETGLADCEIQEIP